MLRWTYTKLEFSNFDVPFFIIFLFFHSFVAHGTLPYRATSVTATETIIIP